MTTVTYTASKAYSGNRPWADVELNPSGSSPVTLKCLVDTGADYLQINAVDATAAGISLATASPTPISTAAGSVTLQLVSGVDVSIEGSRTVKVDVLVDTANTTKPSLVGRQAFLKAFDVGFDLAMWHNT